MRLGSDDVLPELVEESEREAEDEAARARPLADGERIDPNRADERELDRLPGIGPATARAIVAAREEGGGFRSTDDLVRVRGIGPATVKRLEPHLDLSEGVPLELSRVRPEGPDAERIDVNRADAATLQRLPGIGPALAARIVEERGRRPFATVEELVRVRGIGPAILERLRERISAGGMRP